MVTGVRERSSIRSMTFQKNLLGLVVPEPCSSWCCAETPAAAMQIARATSRVAAVERGMASCVLGGSGDGLEKACERARGVSLDRQVSSFYGKPAGESGARAPAAEVLRSISRRRFEADALFDRTFSVTGNARKSRRAKPPTCRARLPFADCDFFDASSSRANRRDSRGGDPNGVAYTGARPSDGRTPAMASKRITKELQVRVHAVRLGARLDRARVARRGGFPGSPRVARNEAMARRGEACRVSRRLGNAPRTSPRPSPRGHDRANRLTTTPRVFPTRNRISKRIPRRPAAPGRGRTMTFSTGTPPSSDLRTRLTRVAFSSWPFTCVSPPARRRRAPRERDPERASARAGNSDARSARASASTPPVADPAPAPRLSSPAIWQRETEFFVFSKGARARDDVRSRFFSQKAKRDRPKRRA